MEHFDVVIVGAGVSGIGAACHLRTKCPHRTFVILETRDAIGGTWDLFRYPGIRSDSDMHTFGYSFKPWLSTRAIADGPSIRAYVHEAATEHEVTSRIRFRQRVTEAFWSTSEARWTVTSLCTDSGEQSRFTCNFLFMCSGYYNYEQGHQPEFPGIEQFAGTLIHPQAWPEDLDYTGKRVAVIGSGATAMTLVPAIAEKAARVTMVQRSPSYVISRPERDAINSRLRRFLSEKAAYAITRWKNILFQMYVYRRTRVAPESIKAKLLGEASRHLGSDYVGKHFTPRYYPWDQRLCLIPDGDLFEAIKRGKAAVATGTIAGITPRGVRLDSGEEIEADILVTATGLQLAVLGGVRFHVDGAPLNIPDKVNYKGIMLSDMPNFAYVFGYVNASWTLRADLTCEYVCRLLNRMDELEMRQCTARLRDQDKDMEMEPWIVGFTPGYMARSMHLFPRQGSRDPWRNTQNYLRDRKLVLRDPLEDGALTFSNPRPLAVPASSSQAAASSQVAAAEARTAA